MIDVFLCLSCRSIYLLPASELAMCSRLTFHLESHQQKFARRMSITRCCFQALSFFLSGHAKNCMMIHLLIHFHTAKPMMREKRKSSLPVINQRYDEQKENALFRRTRAVGEWRGCGYLNNVKDGKLV